MIDEDKFFPVVLQSDGLDAYSYTLEVKLYAFSATPDEVEVKLLKGFSSCMASLTHCFSFDSSTYPMELIVYALSEEEIPVRFEIDVIIDDVEMD